MTKSRNPDVSPVCLLDVAGGGMVDAELWDAITEKNLADWEAEWTPELFKLLQSLHRQGVERRFWPQSRHWDWRDKMKAIESRSLSSPSFSIVCQDMTQGMMITDLTKRAKLPGQKDDHLVYVDFLEVAPWNRQALTQTVARFAGAGTLLVLAAIELSKQEGFKGRIGLHSLPQANDFYGNKVGMSDFGLDATYQNLRYFEMTPEQAEAFLKKGRIK